MQDINRLKLVLVEKKRTNKWLSEQLGINPSTVSKWCTNSSQPDLETLIKIASLLEVNVQDLSILLRYESMAINDKKVKYDSGINVLGSIPDYVAMLEFI